MFFSYTIYHFGYHPSGRVDSKNANLLTKCHSKIHIEKTIFKFVQGATTQGPLFRKKRFKKRNKKRI
jgi:hypothetical protein